MRGNSQAIRAQRVRRSHLSRTWSLGGLTKMQLAREVFISADEHDLLGKAAQLSFYFLLALFPLILFLSAVLGYVFSAEEDLYTRLLQYLGAIMPWTAYQLVSGTVHDIVAGTSRGKVSLGLALALWTGSTGMVAVIEGLNTAYGVTEKRPWWKRRLVALVFTVFIGVLSAVAMMLTLAGDTLSAFAAGVFPASYALSTTSAAAKWMLAVCCMLTALLVIYRFAPNLADQGFEAVLPGALVALLGWFFASSVFRLYLEVFDSLSKTYGSLGAVMALMLWLYLTAGSILVGGEVNSVIRIAVRARVSKTTTGAS